MNISQSAIGQFETNPKPPKLETLQKIANALEVPVSSLLGDNDLTGKTQQFQPLTQDELCILNLGGPGVLAEFSFLPQKEKENALKDIQRFVEFTLSKYKQDIPRQDEPKKDE